MKKSFRVSWKAQIEFSWSTTPQKENEQSNCSMWLSIIDSIMSIATSIKSLF